MTLPGSSRFQFTADLNVCRILNGMWQVSGAHGAIDPGRAVNEMSAYHDAGLPPGTSPTITALPRTLLEPSGASSPLVMGLSASRKFRRLQSGFRVRAG